MLWGLLAIALTCGIALLLGWRDHPDLEDHISAVLLRRGEMYLFDLQDGIEEDFGYVPKVSRVWLKLRSLEREGVVTSRWGDQQLEDCGGAQRKYYRLSGKRRFQLKERRTQWLHSWLSNPSHVSLAVLLPGNPGLEEAHRIATRQTLDLIDRQS